MIVCVPMFGRRVAPYFGSPSVLSFYEVKRRGVLKKKTIELTADDPMQMARKIAENKPDALVCGGVQNFCKNWLELRGISVFDNQKGEAKEVIANLSSLELFKIHRQS